MKPGPVASVVATKVASPERSSFESRPADSPVIQLWSIARSRSAFFGVLSISADSADASAAAGAAAKAPTPISVFAMRHLR